VLGHRLDGAPDRLLDERLVGGGVVEHLFERHLGVVFPHVVVGDAGDGRVTELGLAGELRLRNRGHADYLEAGGAEMLRFGLRRVLRPLDTDVRAVLDDLGVGGVAGAVGEMRLHMRAVRLGELHVDDTALLEEGVAPAPRPVEYLVGDDERLRLQLLAQRADGVGREHALDAEGLQRVDVRAVRRARR